MYKVKSTLSSKEEYLSLRELKFKYGTVITGDLFEAPFTEHVLNLNGETITISKED